MCVLKFIWRRNAIGTSFLWNAIGTGFLCKFSNCFVTKSSLASRLVDECENWVGVFDRYVWLTDWLITCCCKCSFVFIDRERESEQHSTAHQGMRSTRVGGRQKHICRPPPLLLDMKIRYTQEFLLLLIMKKWGYTSHVIKCPSCCFPLSTADGR